MKKLLIMLMVIAMASFLLVGCVGEGVVVDEEEEEEEEEVTAPTTVAPIITSVSDIDITSSATQYVNKAEAADGIVVNGTAPTYSEVKVYINGITAGTGDAGANGVFQVVVANADLIKAGLKVDGAKTLYATAIEAGLAESGKSNEVLFTLDTAAPKIKAVKARAGALRLYNFAETTDSLNPLPGSDVSSGPFSEVLVNTDGTIDAAAGGLEWLSVPALTAGTVLQMGERIVSPFTTIPVTNPLMAGVKKWKLEIITVAAVTTMRVYNLTDATSIDYTYTTGLITSTSWIPGLAVTVVLLIPSDVGGYCLITTTNTPEVLGRVSLTFDGDVSFTAATGGAYTIYNNSVGWDILSPAGVTRFMAYNETTDTMFWQELVTFGWWDLAQGDWLTFQVDSVADVAGNAITVGSPETANCTVLASSVAVGP